MRRILPLLTSRCLLDVRLYIIEVHAHCVDQRSICEVQRPEPGAALRQRRQPRVGHLVTEAEVQLPETATTQRMQSDAA